MSNKVCSEQTHSTAAGAAEAYGGREKIVQISPLETAFRHCCIQKEFEGSRIISATCTNIVIPEELGMKGECTSRLLQPFSSVLGLLFPPNGSEKVCLKED